MVLQDRPVRPTALSDAPDEVVRQRWRDAGGWPWEGGEPGWAFDGEEEFKPPKSLEELMWEDIHKARSAQKRTIQKSRRQTPTVGTRRSARVAKRRGKS